MKRPWTIFTLLLFVMPPLLPLTANGDEPDTATASESEWETLFDGESTAAWRNYKQDDLGSGWQVVDGALVKTAKRAGDIITREKFNAFELELEFKISPGGNSGVMYHVVETDGPPWHTGPEIQIQDNVAGHDPQKCGWLYQFYSSDKDATKPAGQWNKLRVVISPEGCQHVVNGVEYFTYKIGSDDWNQKLAKSKFGKLPGFGAAGSGHICLQDHGDEVAYRNIRVRRLDKSFPTETSGK